MKTIIIFILAILLVGTWLFLFLTSSAPQDTGKSGDSSKAIIEPVGPMLPPKVKTTDNGQNIETSGPMLPPMINKTPE